MTLPVAVQPAPAAPPAPRAARAAASSEPAVGFEAMLSRSTSETPSAKRDVSRDDVLAASAAPDEEREHGQDVSASSVAVVVLQVPAVVAPVTPEADDCAIDACEGQDEQTAAAMAPEDVVVGAITEESQEAAVPIETSVCEPIPASQLKSDPVDIRSDARNETPERSGVAATPVEPAMKSLAATEAAAVADESTKAAPEPSAPIATAEKAPVVAPRRAESRSAARAIVSEFLQVHPAIEPSRKPVEAGAATAVATAPLQPGSAPAPGEPVAARPGKAATPSQPVIEADHVPADLSQLSKPGSDARNPGGERRHDGGWAQAGPRGAFGTTEVPASMAFPQQMTFASAIDRAASTVPVVPPAPATPEQLATVGPQVVRSMHMQVKAGGGDITLTLTPEHLGTVTIELRVDQQKVSATLGADTAAVRGWMAAHEQELKAGLSDLGLKLEEFVVRDDDPRQQREQRQQHPPNGRRKPERIDQPVFEVVV